MCFGGNKFNKGGKTACLKMRSHQGNVFSLLREKLRGSEMKG